MFDAGSLTQAPVVPVALPFTYMGTYTEVLALAFVVAGERTSTDYAVHIGLECALEVD